MMEEIRDDNSKTVFYKAGRMPALRRYAWILLVIAIVIGVVVIWGSIGAGAREALSDAKDIRVAMKLVSLEFYSGDTSIYDASSEDGLGDGALDRIKALFSFDGDIKLSSWDYENSIPLSFSYRDGKYLVEYKETGNGDGSYGMNGSWSVYYDLKVLEYTTGD